jgi:Protein of unknown function (DUF3570)
LIGMNNASLVAPVLAAALALPGVQAARAQAAPDQATLAIKLLDYQDSQPGADRIRVQAPAVSLVAPLSSRWSLSGSLVTDSISGASPAYHSSALTRLKDFRRAGDIAVSHHGDSLTVTAGAHVSSESDYRSRGGSLQFSHASEDRNTTGSFGIAASSDRIDPVNRAVRDERKRSIDMVAGLTQVLGTHDILALSLGMTRGHGYYSDPYKVFDRRPRKRTQHRLQLRWNHHLDASDTTLRSSWRWTDDSFGIRSHTLGLEIVQALPGGFTLTPLLRLYTQGAARFYVDADPSSEPFPPNPPSGALYSSEDHRLSAFGARTWGLKLGWQVNPAWQADVKFERYEQRGSWRLDGTGSSGLAPFRARTVQVGLSTRF